MDITVQFDYTGQVVMVTGASAGMALAAAQAFARAGAATALVDVDEAAVRAVADELAGRGHQVLALVGDVSDETQVASVVADIVAAYGRLDAAFKNAGIIMPPTKTADTDNATFDRIGAVNLAGVWNCLKHEMLQMRTQQSGTIVSNSSIAGLKSGSSRSAYTATKHAVVALTKSAALEEGAQGIRVNAVCPGTITTPMVEGMVAVGESRHRRLRRPPPSHDSDAPTRVAEAVPRLCSTSASYVTGVALPVDGGLAAG